MDQQTRIKEIIQQHGWKRILLAVSGGLDSICLAYYFIANKEALGIEWLGIAHVHHGLREGTADLDEKWVRDFAATHGISFFCAHLDGVALKSAEGSLEENARKARYEALLKIADEIAGSPAIPVRRGQAPGMTSERIAIVTAHHAGDQAETLYMRLRRGTTLEGLRGMVSLAGSTWSRVSNQATPSSLIYRPFLSVPHRELQEYARENNLEWREDESNNDTKFTRNKIRHESLPALENDIPGSAEQLARIASLANSAYGKILDAADALFSPALVPAETFETASGSAFTAAELPEKRIAIDKKKLRKILEKHANSDLSEMFRLWLSAKGFRFPVDFFKHETEPADVRIPVRAAYRTRSIAKFGHTVWICDFGTANAAAKFVSCG